MHKALGYHLALSEIQSSLALIVSFKSPIFRWAQDDISGAGGGGALGLGLRISCSLSDAGGVAAGSRGSIVDALSVGEGVNAVHEARKKAAKRYLMTSSRGATGR
jgi:hypothetical protein